MTIDPRVIELCREFDVEIIPAHRYPDVGQTRAVKTIQRIMRRHGEAHMRLVMTTLAETANNRACMDEVAFWAASDLVRAYADVIERDMTGFLEVWDSIPVGQRQWEIQQRLSGFVNQRAALAGVINQHLYERFDAPQPELPLEAGR